MADLNMMMRDQARAGLQTELDAAVVAGDSAAAKVVAEKIAALAVQSAPKPPPYNDLDIKGELEKLAPWYGTDARKSRLALDLAKNGLDISKFATAKLFAEAIVKGVDEEFKPAAAEPGEGDEDPADEGDEDTKKPTTPARKRSDAPAEGDTLTRARSATRTGPWAKLSDAPKEIAADITRQADKFVPAKAPKEQREKFIANALASHYNAHQQKAKK